ncbi:MAG: hypothetical protein U0514_04245 [Candidatus Andersenbacteria bacterium]
MRQDPRARDFQRAAAQVEKELAELRARGAGVFSKRLDRLRRLFANLRGERLTEPDPWYLVYVTGGFKPAQEAGTGLVRLEPMVAFELAGPLSRRVRGVTVRFLNDALVDRCGTCGLYSRGTYVVRCASNEYTLCLVPLPPGY